MVKCAVKISGSLWSMHYAVIGDLPIPGFKWIFCPMGLGEFYIHKMPPCYLQSQTCFSVVFAFQMLFLPTTYRFIFLYLYRFLSALLANDIIVFIFNLANWTCSSWFCVCNPVSHVDLFLYTFRAPASLHYSCATALCGDSHIWTEVVGAECGIAEAALHHLCRVSHLHISE